MAVWWHDYESLMLSWTVLLNYVGTQLHYACKAVYVECSVCLLVGVHGDCMMMLWAHMTIWLYGDKKRYVVAWLSCYIAAWLNVTETCWVSILPALTALRAAHHYQHGCDHASESHNSKLGYENNIPNISSIERKRFVFLSLSLCLKTPYAFKLCGVRLSAF